MDLGSLASTFFVCLLAAAVFMSGMFAIGRRMRRYDIVDVSWGLVFIVIAMTALLQSDAISTIDVALLLMVSVWGLRLSSHIYRRLRTTSAEDKRYVEMRKKWQSGNEDVAIFARIYMTQALLATLISLPVIIVVVATVEVPFLITVAGVSIWLVGIVIESLADRQLRTFIRNPENKGRLMMSGLWRYSRHPNYFGELTLWWGVGVIALGVPFGWIGLFGPALISYLIIFVSGIPPTEKAFAGRLGWDEYVRRTSVLIPWFPRKDANS